MDRTLYNYEFQSLPEHRPNCCGSTIRAGNNCNPTIRDLRRVGEVSHAKATTTLSHDLRNVGVNYETFQTEAFLGRGHVRLKTSLQIDLSAVSDVSSDGSKDIHETFFDKTDKRALGTPYGNRFAVNEMSSSGID